MSLSDDLKDARLWDDGFETLTGTPVRIVAYDRQGDPFCVVGFIGDERAVATWDRQGQYSQVHVYTGNSLRRRRRKVTRFVNVDMAPDWHTVVQTFGTELEARTSQTVPNGFVRAVTAKPVTF